LVLLVPCTTCKASSLESRGCEWPSSKAKEPARPNRCCELSLRANCQTKMLDRVRIISKNSSAQQAGTPTISASVEFCVSMHGLSILQSSMSGCFTLVVGNTTVVGRSTLTCLDRYSKQLHSQPMEFVRVHGANLLGIVIDGEQ
jgi:hypothetical protein